MKAKEERAALVAMMKDAPHALATWTGCRSPDAWDLRYLVSEMEEREFSLGPARFRIRYCWEVLDLMKRNLAPMPLDHEGKAKRGLRYCKQTWAAMQEAKQKAVTSRAAA